MRSDLHPRKDCHPTIRRLNYRVDVLKRLVVGDGYKIETGFKRFLNQLRRIHVFRVKMKITLVPYQRFPTVRPWDSSFRRSSVFWKAMLLISAAWPDSTGSGWHGNAHGQGRDFCKFAPIYCLAISETIQVARSPIWLSGPFTGESSPFRRSQKSPAADPD